MKFNPATIKTIKLILGTTAVVGFFNYGTYKAELKETEELRAKEYKWSIDLNNDGRKDWTFSSEFGGRKYISLPNGKFEQVEKNKIGYTSVNGKRVYTEDGLMIDRENSKLVDMVTGKGVELK